MTSFLIFLAAIAVVIFYAISIYNSLINLRNRVKNAFAQIDVQLTRRHDLIPNLVEAVKGYMKHERETLEAVINARNSAVSSLDAAKADPSNAAAIQQLGESEGALGAALGRLFMSISPLETKWLRTRSHPQTNARTYKHFLEGDRQ